MFARVAFDLPVPTEFTYSVPDELTADLIPGQRVRVPFRTRTKIGYVVTLEEATDLDPQKIKALYSIVDPEPLLPPDLMKLARWIANYYCCALGEAIQAMLPGGVRKRRPKVKVVVRVDSGSGSGSDRRVDEGRGEKEGDTPPAPAPPLPKRAKKAIHLLGVLNRHDDPVRMKDLLDEAGVSRAALTTLERAGLARVEARDADEEFFKNDVVERQQPPTLESAQEHALAALCDPIASPSFGVHLLLGVTGSGKTEVYLQAIRLAVEQGRQAIVLVPEIALTPQTVRRFRARFDRVAVLHSQQTERERRQAWRQIRRGEADVVIGPRSAVFAPVTRLGLIVVDEEHEGSFKQEHAPRYHARDVAIMRARAAPCPVVLGSATPSLESYANARRDRYELHLLPERAGGYPLPPVEVVDLAEERGRLFSTRLRYAVSEAVADGGQVILFLNRRGFSTLVKCVRCEHMLECPNCSALLVFHKGRRRTVCHLCQHEARITPTCPECHGQGSLQYAGTGTERLEEEAAAAWPGVPLLRVDSDSVRGKSLEAALETFRRGDARIMVGTQMIAKGHHFPDVTLVGIINADTALHLPDFRANERTFSLIAQVAGRAGRGDRGGRVIVQTFHPDHYAVEAASRHAFEEFALKEIEERAVVGLPPSRRAALIIASSESEDLAQQAIDQAAGAVRAWLKTRGQKKRNEQPSLLAPAEATTASAPVDERVDVRGPAKAPIERLRGRWRYMLLLLSESPTALSYACRGIRSLKPPRRTDLTVDVDPSAVL